MLEADIEENDSTLNLVNYLLSTKIDNNFSIESSYKKIVSEYEGYTGEDILTLCKIDRLFELGIIDEDIKWLLTCLYHEKMRLEDELLVCDSQEGIDVVNNRIIVVMDNLKHYGVSNVNLRALLDSSIKEKADEKNTKLRKKLK